MDSKNRKDGKKLNWWENNNIFILSEGHAKARPGAEFWFNSFWKPRQPSAWGYELARAWAQRGIRLKPEEKELVSQLPSYDVLDWKEQEFLKLVFDTQLATDSTAEGEVVSKQGKIHNLLNWWHVSDRDVDRDKRVKKYVRRYWPLVVAFAQSRPMENWKLVSPPRIEHALAGNRISKEEFESAFSRAKLTRSSNPILDHGEDVKKAATQKMGKASKPSNAKCFVHPVHRRMKNKYPTLVEKIAHDVGVYQANNLFAFVTQEMFFESHGGKDAGIPAEEILSVAYQTLLVGEIDLHTADRIVVELKTKLIQRVTRLDRIASSCSSGNSSSSRGCLEMPAVPCDNPQMVQS